MVTAPELAAMTIPPLLRLIVRKVVELEKMAVVPVLLKTNP